ncbi:MAG: ACP S-malonyltransferase [Candidatus Omnitrophota bacterium]
MVAYIFPGQGAQYVGMGRELYETSPEAKSIFDKGEEILPEVGIKRLCFEGPIEELTSTSNSQVTILVASIACLEALRSKVRHEDILSCLGLSLGELTSLVAVESISFEDAVRLVRKRGELMEEASNKNPGTMASIIGLSLDKLKEVCRSTGAQIANLNCPGQVVISGKKEFVEDAMKRSTESGAKKAIPLNVSGPFHSSLMKEAGELFRKELEKVEFKVPKIKIVSNVTGDFESTPEEIKDNLVKQLYSSVLWEDSIKKVVSLGVKDFFEIGPGKVLKGLLRRIDKDLNVINIEKSKDIDTVISNQITDHGSRITDHEL